MDRREKLIGEIDFTTSLIVEIGALCNPILTKSEANVRYVDYTDADTLRRHYAGNSLVDPEKIVETDAIWGENNLLQSLGTKVDFILASHVIEHVPDLITWLSELQSALSDRGEIRLAIPDKRFTFDFFRRKSEIAEVITAYLTRSRAPQPYALLDYYLNATEVDSSAIWRGEFPKRPTNSPERVLHIIDLAKDAQTNGTYHDAHCWVFTPASLGQLLEQLARVGLLQLACTGFHDTEKYGFEFFVSMKPSLDRSVACESWRRMSEAARAHESDCHDGISVANPDVPGTLWAELETIRVMVERLLNSRSPSL
jgi:hypothetical protein